MPDESLVPLQVVVAKVNPQIDLCNITTFADLLDAIQRSVFVDGTLLLARVREQIFVGPQEPTGPNKGKIWFKNDDPAGIGILVDGVYQMFTFPEKEEAAGRKSPPSSVVFWPAGAIAPDGYEKLPASQYPIPEADLNPAYTFIRVTS